VPSNLQIIDYCHGFTGSAHDAAAFEHTCAFKTPEYLFEGEEFAWADSAYTISPTMIPVHRQPASFIRENSIFDKLVSHIRIRSEHCMGALKGRFQSLRGLRVNIFNNYDHKKACQWVTIAIILHNLIIDVEGSDSVTEFLPNHTPVQEAEDAGHDEVDVDAGMGEQEGEAKRRRLTAEVLAFKEL
jgi:hypothetical protein